MTTVIEKLEERGYWRVELRPTSFDSTRVANTKRLQLAIEKARVELRGWDFPHIGAGWELPESQDWIGVETDWHSHVEIWRAFRSGQFVYRGGIWTDWLDQSPLQPQRVNWTPGTRLPIISTLWSVTEYLEFAARYSQTEAGADDMFVRLDLSKLRGRHLHGDDERRWFGEYGPANLRAFSFSRQLGRSQLITEARQLAISCAQELFAAFGFEAGPLLLEDLQQELFRFRNS